MKFRVVWKTAARNELADVWLNSPDRNAVAAASHLLEQQLMHQPLDVGESREGEYRIVFVGALSAMYHVSLTDRVVRIVQVKSSYPRGA